MSCKPDNPAGNKIPLLVLTGPTAVGKSTLALRLAPALGTDIISADSAQVYRNLDIGTAKPTREEQKAVKHHLIDLVDPDQDFSAADYQKAAAEVIERLYSAGKLPFMVGGTGLYIKAVIDFYAFGQKGADRELRDYYEKKASSEGLARLYTELKAIDPAAAAKIHPGDRRRIIRALEVYRLEGRPISEQVVKTEREKSPYSPTIIGLYMDREALYRKIEKRVDRMLEEGLLEEVSFLQQKGYGRKTPGMQILGYRQLLSYLQGEMSWEETVAEIKKQTRNLAKRQLTWFRRDDSIKWFKIDEDTPVENLTENIYEIVKDSVPTRANNRL